jgi:hypothetical protein
VHYASRLNADGQFAKDANKEAGMKGLLKRMRGALGIAVLGALAFHLIGWLSVGVEALSAGMWPSRTLIARMSLFTIPVGGFVGLMTAGAIALGAGSSRLVGRWRAFLIGLPIGAVGGLLLSLYAGGGLPISALVVNAITFAVGTGALGAGAVMIAGVSNTKRLERPAQQSELPRDI